MLSRSIDQAVTSEIDPFSREFLANPYPYHEQLREAGPVVRLAHYDAWAVFRHEQVQAVLNDWQTFSSGAGVRFGQFPQRGQLASAEPAPGNRSAGSHARAHRHEPCIVTEDTARAT